MFSGMFPTQSLCLLCFTAHFFILITCWRHCLTIKCSFAPISSYSQVSVVVVVDPFNLYRLTYDCWRSESIRVSISGGSIRGTPVFNSLGSVICD